MTIATTILQQLGGNRFVAMTGAKQFMDTGKGLQFTLGRNKLHANRVIITLDASDTYTVTFYKLARMRTANPMVKVVKEVDGVYADQLQAVFTNATGLDTHL